MIDPEEGNYVYYIYAASRCLALSYKALVPMETAQETVTSEVSFHIPTPPNILATNISLHNHYHWVHSY